ncbi:MAG: ABC-F family ATP-binding cassette domain-containing protein [Rhodospirillaceae bacterium]|nr:ABC-F family ATP-binding cassette domain-containing protein [Rhodospirillaceae bacterium]
MSLLIASHLTVSHGIAPLVHDAGFSVGENDRIGLVGANGSGKSTLLAALAGRMEIDAGDLALRRGLTMGFSEQEVPDQLFGMTLRDALMDALPEAMRDSDAWKVDVALSSLGFPYEFHERLVSKLSGGWQRLVLIARAHLPEPDLLLLDEPTNHLDLAKILHLERWLEDEVRGPLIMVSHDREVLDRCTTRTMFLRDAVLHDFPGNYTRARQLLVERDLSAAKAREAEESEIKRLARSAKRLALWGKVFDNEKFSKRARSMEMRIEKKKADVTYVAPEDRRKLALADGDSQANILLRCNNCEISAPNGDRLFGIERLALARGDRAVILGVNGSGKSTYLKRLMVEYENHGDRIAEKAEVYFNPQVLAGYFDQDLSRLPDDQPMFRFFATRFPVPDLRVRSELVHAGFPHTNQTRKIGTLSGGERARLLFLLLKFEQPNVLILDEPTNHLDVDGRERLEDAILTRELTCVMVSHDRRFVDGVANRFFIIERGRLIETDSADPFYDLLLED